VWCSDVKANKAILICWTCLNVCCYLASRNSGAILVFSEIRINFMNKTKSSTAPVADSVKKPLVDGNKETKKILTGQNLKETWKHGRQPSNGENRTTKMQRSLMSAASTSQTPPTSQSPLSASSISSTSSNNKSFHHSSTKFDSSSSVTTRRPMKSKLTTVPTVAPLTKATANVKSIPKALQRSTSSTPIAQNAIGNTDSTLPDPAHSKHPRPHVSSNVSSPIQNQNNTAVAKVTARSPKASLKVNAVESLRGSLSPRGTSPPSSPRKNAAATHTRTRSGSLRSSAEIARLLKDPEFREELRLKASPQSSSSASFAITSPPLSHFVQHPRNKIKGHLIETTKDMLIVAVGEEIHVWDLKQEELLLLFTGHSSPVNCLTVVNGSEECVSCSNTETLVWLLRTGQCTHHLTEGAKAVGVYCMDISSATSPPPTPSSSSSSITPRTTNSYRVITAHLTKPVCTLWNLHTPTHAFIPLRQLTGHKGLITSLLIVERNSETRRAALCITGSNDKTAKVWNLDTGECLQTLSGHNASIESISLSIDGRKLITFSSSDMTFKVWQLKGTEQWPCVFTATLKRPVDRHTKLITIQNGTNDDCCRNDYSQFASDLFVFDTEPQPLGPKDEDCTVSCASSDICLILT